MQLKSPKEILDLKPKQQIITGKSRTKQAESELTDINKIVARHRKSGQITHINGNLPIYGDFTQASDLHNAYIAVQDARESFDELPASVRAAADNDPVQLLTMLADEEGTELLVEAGLDATIIDRENSSQEPFTGSSPTTEPTSAPPPEASQGDPTS